MAKRNLQNANNQEKPSEANPTLSPISDGAKTTKRGFFDIEDTPQETETFEADSASTQKVSPQASVTEQSKNRFTVMVAIFLCAVAVFSVGAYMISKLDFVVNSSYGDDGEDDNSSPPIVFEIYEPDWETDIFTLDEYLALNPDRIEYSDDQGLSSSRVDPEDLEKVGGAKLVFLNSYFDAVKRGDHEAVNAMLSEDYIKENGKYEPFPMQKLFDIKIERKYYNDPAFDNLQYDDYYFVVRYNIYRNDGMFRADCDDQYYCRTLMRVLVDENGNGYVDMVINYQGA